MPRLEVLKNTAELIITIITNITNILVITVIITISVCTDTDVLTPYLPV